MDKEYDHTSGHTGHGSSQATASRSPGRALTANEASISGLIRERIADDLRRGASPALRDRVANTAVEASVRAARLEVLSGMLTPEVETFLTCLRELVELDLYDASFLYRAVERSAKGQHQGQAIGGSSIGRIR